MDVKDSPHELWQYVLTQVELSVSPANFNTWFKDSSIMRIDDGVVHIGVPSPFFRDWYLKKFHTLLLKILRGISYEFRNIAYDIVKDERRKPMRELRVERGVMELPLDDFYINKADNLNPRYTLDTFVVGSFNEIAYAAAQAAINRPGITYNPLFVYGDTGRGKTHLIQAVGNQFKKQYSGRKVFYLTSEKFAVEYTDSVQAGTANRFKDKYRQYDLLIMDDVQFLSKKEKTQEELFHLFNTLHDTNKQILFSSDRPPSAISDITDRLAGRLASGMAVDIGEPDMESRMAIVRKKAAIHAITLSDEVVEHVASTASGSIRELEGMVNSIVCFAQVKGIVPDIAEERYLNEENEEVGEGVDALLPIEGPGGKRFLFLVALMLLFKVFEFWFEVLHRPLGPSGREGKGEEEESNGKCGENDGNTNVPARHKGNKRHEGVVDWIIEDGVEKRRNHT